jgi:phosphate starvation-inducible PhoH-like protein
MFLTRLGFGSRMVVTGDITQVDLPTGQASGLRLVQDILEGVEDIQFSRLTSHDVVRHRLVGDIVNAYAAYEARTGGMAGPVRDGSLRGRAGERGDGRAGSRGPGKRAQ